jgi:MoaA/NifB/PqqE/SkfB family radical SAM enzyme
MIKKKIITILPTKSCNFKCKFCGILKSDIVNSISLKTVETVLKDVAKNGVKSLQITGGGEPLLDFEKTIKIIKLAKRNGFNRISICTNGYFIANPNPQDAIKKLKDVNVIVFSLDYDHLKFISYSKILRTIKTTLGSHINVHIKMCNRKMTKYKNLLLLKKLSKDLNGKLINLTPLIGNLYFMQKYYLIFGSKLVTVESSDTIKTNTNKNIESFKPMGLRYILFMPCDRFYLVIDSDSNILPCISFHSFNYPKIYSFGKVREKNSFKNPNNILNSILYDTFPFMKIFLRIRKDKKLFNKFLKQKYYSHCDFCLQILKHKKKIEKIKPPSNYEIIIFSISNLYYIFISTLNYILMKFYFIIFYKIRNFIHFFENF